MLSVGFPKLRLPSLRLSGRPAAKIAAKEAARRAVKPASGEGGPSLRLVPGTNVPAVGARIGRYELLGPLGAGGMAEVHKARAVGPGGFERNVVIKRILPGQAKDPEFIQMFMDEAKILGMLHHPNVVQAYDFGEDNGNLFLALEYVDGPSVSRLLRTLRATHRRIPPVIAAYIAREVCRALAYLQQTTDAAGQPLNVIHRDVTPSNIMMTTSGGVKLLDFGVAKFSSAEQATRAGTVKGKPAYLAPEQLEGKPIDGRVDLFALGIVLHEMLTLEHLFAGDSDLVTVKKILEMEVSAPSAKRDDVPPALDHIVMRALERDRSKRFSSAVEMARELDSVVLAAKLSVEDVADFIANLEAEVASQGRASVRPIRMAPPPLPAEAVAVTQRDLGLAPRLGTLGDLFWGRRKKGTMLAGAALVLVGVATVLGLQASVTAQANVGGGQAGAAEMAAP